jgi:glyoxylase-like metal-dependent hydrolase (beta-lactamase superfamily II)
MHGFPIRLLEGVRMRVIDVMHLGRAHVIGCWEVDGLLVDPGPESSLPTLLEALGEERPRALLLTHIHLDHAAATGALVRRWPDLEVYVHERGAPHLIDPSKLLASAGRLYGDQMERLWGEIVPVPEANVKPLSGGEQILGMRVAYTPGHASHHVCYLHEESGTAFVGDVAAVRLPGVNLIVPPTPPPDIDIELWEDSIGIVESWQPEKLALTHFAAIEDPKPHLARVRERLREEAQLARELPEDAYERRHRDLVAEHAESTDSAEELIQCVPPQYQWRGLNRYWTKREQREAA